MQKYVYSKYRTEATEIYLQGLIRLNVLHKIKGFFLASQVIFQLLDSLLRQTANVNLQHVTKFSPYFSFTVYCFYTKIDSFMPVLSLRIVLDCFYVLIFYFEKFSTHVCRLPYAANVNLNLSIVFTSENQDEAK